MTKTEAKRYNLPYIITEHIKTNLKAYIIISLIFFVGIFLGVMFVNNSDEAKKEKTSTYINNYINYAKENKKISSTETLKNSIKENVIIAVELWFAGTTLIGIPIVFAIIIFRGFCLGYTISACTYTMGMGKGIAFIITSLLLQNILFIPAIFALGVSGIKLYKSITKDRTKENIKLEILRHTVFSIIMLVILVVSAIIKANLSCVLLEMIVKYF